jgi:6-pyruvoyl-tetrahydropterin synthase related domain
MKAPARTWTRQAFIVLGALIAGTVMASPFFVHRGSGGKGLWMVSTHDMVQHLAVMKDFDRVLKSGTLYPRWLPDINNGYGIPWMNFYPPGFYYVASLVNAVLNDWVRTLFAISALGFAASGLAFYWLARAFYGRMASAVAALFYMVLPYHVINLYWQGAMPQFLGFIFLPLTLLFAFRVGAQGRARDYAGLGLFYGAYLMTHAPVSFLMSYTLAFYGLLWAAQERDWKIAFRIAIGMVLGLSLGAIYWLPAAIETKDIQEHFSAIFPYHNSYITLLPLEGFGNLLNHSFALQTVTIIAAALTIRAFSRTSGPSKPSSQAGEPGPVSSRQTRLWIVLAAVTTFMSTSFSIYISKLLPKIQVATFAWRWLAISSLFTALLVGAALDRLRERSKLTAMRRWAYGSAIAALMVWSVLFTVQGVIKGALSNAPFSTPTDYVEAGFTPINSTAPQSLPETPTVVIQPEGGASEIIRWEPYHRLVAVRLDQPSEVRIKTYNFPGWTASVDGEKVPLSSDKDGVQVVSVPAGRHKIESSFVNTPPRTAGALLSALALLAVVGLAGLDRVREARRAGGEAVSRKALYVRSLKPLAPIVAALLIGAALLFWLGGRGRSAPASGSDAPARAGRSATLGSEAVLHIDGVPSVMAAVDERALDELMNALPARDNSRVESLVQSAQVLRVANDTHVRILEFGGGKTKVRILQGEHLMAEVWVPERWIR